MGIQSVFCESFPVLDGSSGLPDHVGRDERRLVMPARLFTWVAAEDAACLYPDPVDCQRGRRSPAMRSLTSRRAS
jgi:hypothetical protein